MPASKSLNHVAHLVASLTIFPPTYFGFQLIFVFCRSVMSLFAQDFGRKICLNVFCFRKLAVRILGIWDLGAAKVEHLGPVRGETGQVGWPRNYAVSLGKCWPAKVFRLLAT